MNFIDLFWFVSGVVLATLFFLWKGFIWVRRQKQRFTLLEKELDKQLSQKSKALEDEHKSCLHSLQTSLQRAEIQAKIKGEQYEKEKQLAERKLKDKLQSLTVREQALDKEREKLTNALKRVHELSLEEAVAIVEPRLLQQAKDRVSKELSLLEQAATKKGQEILLQAIERASLKITKELTTITIELRDPRIAPKLIGKDGKIISRLEEMCGVNIRVDNTTSQATITSLNGRRRAFACLLIDQLVKHERISTALLESAHKATNELFESRVIQNGLKLTQHLTFKVSKNVLRAIGDMEYYASQGQNLLQHSLEVAQIAQRLAVDLKLNHEKAYLMGLLHDIGKVLPNTTLTHALQGQMFCLQEGIPTDIANGVGAHHNEILALSEEARLIPIADQLSAGLMGNRKVESDSSLA